MQDDDFIQTSYGHTLPNLSKLSKALCGQALGREGWGERERVITNTLQVRLILLYLTNRLVLTLQLESEHDFTKYSLGAR